MAKKNYTAVKIIGLLALMICVSRSLHYLEHRSSTANPRSHNHLFASQKRSKSSKKSSRSNSISSEDSDSIFSFFDDKSISDFLREPYAIIAIVGGIIFIIYLQSENNIFRNMLTWPGSPSSTESGYEADIDNTTDNGTFIEHDSVDGNVNSSNNETKPSLLNSSGANNATDTERSTIDAQKFPKQSGASGGTLAQIRMPDANYDNNIANTFGYGYTAEELAQLGQQPISANIGNNNQWQATLQNRAQHGTYPPSNNHYTNKYAFVEEPIDNYQLNNSYLINHQQQDSSTADDMDVHLSNDRLDLDNNHNIRQQQNILSFDINFDNDNKPDKNAAQLFNDELKEQEEIAKEEEESNYDTEYDPDYQVYTDTESTYLDIELNDDIKSEILSVHEQAQLQNNSNLTKKARKKLSKEIKKKEQAFTKTFDILTTMLQGQKAKKKVTERDQQRFQLLYATIAQSDKAQTTQGISSKVLSRWNKFRQNQKKLTLNIENMHDQYQKLMPLLFSSGQVLLIDTLIKIFPNVSEIRCNNIDCSGREPNALSYSSDIVNSRFITALKDRLTSTTQNTPNHLTKIIITTSENQVKSDCDLSLAPFKTLGWKIQLENRHRQITLTKASAKESEEAYWKSIIKQGVIPKIAFLIGAEASDNSNLTTASVFSIFKTLLGPKTDQLPPHAVAVWDKFLKGQTRLTFNMEQIYTHYPAFIPLLFASDQKNKHVLLVDKIAKNFPNATEIVCQQVDYVGSAKEYNPDPDGYSPNIVGTNFINGIYTTLRKMDSNKRHLLQEFKITTMQHKISDECHLDKYVGDLNAQGWFLVKEHNSITFTNAPDKYIKRFLPKMSAMINGEELDKKFQFTDSDMLIFTQLISHKLSKSLSNAQKTWDEFSKNQKRLKIDMEYMYRDYHNFLSLVSTPNGEFKHIWLFSMLINTFPNATTLKCKNIDCVEWTKNNNKGRYSNTILGPKLIADLENNLKFVLDSKWGHLESIIITTAKYEVFPDLDLRVMQFAVISWSIKKENYKKARKASKNNKISLVKEKKSHDKIWEGIMHKGILPKMKYIMEAEITEDVSNLTDASVLPIINEFIVEVKNIPLSAQKIWNQFRLFQKKMTITMQLLYKRNYLLRPLFFDPKLKNVLWLDRIAALFPNISEITCEGIDYVGKNDPEYDTDYGFSASLVNSKFMLGLKDKLSTINKQNKNDKLKKIVLKLLKKTVSEECNLYVEELSELSWKIQLDKKPHQITLTKAGKKEDEGAIWAAIIQKGVAPKIKSIIDPQEADKSNLTTAAVVAIFKKLLAPNGDERLPHAHKAWNKFTQKRDKLTFDMEHMYTHAKMFKPLLFSSHPANLLWIGKMIETFPNVKAIRCENIDCAIVDKNGKKAYSADVLNSNFMLGLKNRLHKMGRTQQSKLEKVTLTTAVTKRKDDCNLYAKDLSKLGWTIQEKNRKKKGIKITLTTKNAKSRSKKGSKAQISNDDPYQNDNESDYDDTYTTAYDTETYTDNSDALSISNDNENKQEQDTDIKEEQSLYLSHEQLQQHNLHNNGPLAPLSNLGIDNKNNAYFVIQEEYKDNDHISPFQRRPIGYKKRAFGLSSINESPQDSDNSSSTATDGDQLHSLFSKLLTSADKNNQDPNNDNLSISTEPDRDQLHPLSPSKFQIVDDEHNIHSETSTQPTSGRLTSSSPPFQIIENKHKKANQSASPSPLAPQRNDEYAQEAKKSEQKTELLARFMSKKNKSSEEKHFQAVIVNLERMIKGKKLKDKKALPGISKLLYSTFKDFPKDAEKIWDEFRKKQKELKFDIKCMHQYYSIDKQPLLCEFGGMYKNILLLDKIVTIFPNVTEITCENTDYVGKNPDILDRKGDYAPSAVFVQFRGGLAERLRKINKQSKLEKIIIKTQKYEINNDDKSYQKQFERYDKQFKQAGWDVVKEKKTLILINADKTTSTTT